MLTTQKDLINKLYQLRTVKPDASFATRSRSLIFAMEKPVYRWSLFWSLAGAVALIMLIFAVSFSNFGGSVPTVSASLNPDKLSQEFNNLSINIELREITYHQAVNQTIASALTEITDNRTKHLNSDFLKSEEQSLNPDSIMNPAIDELLNQVIF